MKKTSMKLVALGMIIGILGSTGAGLAHSKLTSIAVNMDPIHMSINGEDLTGHGIDKESGQYFNGKKLVPTSMIYEGTTYVPVRLAAESFGYQVEWDDKGRMIHFENGAGPLKPKPVEIVAGKLETTISHSPNKDGGLDFKFVVKNQTEHEMMLDFTSGQRFDYVIRDSKGEVVKTYSADKLFMQALGKETLKQGEEWVLTDTIDSLPKGVEYTLEFWVTSKEKQGKQTYTFSL